jgi:hypothetical protein
MHVLHIGLITKRLGVTALEDRIQRCPRVQLGHRVPEAAPVPMDVSGY